MKIKRSWVASGIILAGLVLALSSNGCSDDDENNDMATRTGKKGEVCQTTRDCAPGLACIPRVVGSSGTSSGGSSVILGSGGTCVVGVFNVAPTGKECAITQCDTVDDCCKSFGIGTSQYCQSQKELCEGPNANDTICDNYRQACVCDTNRFTCDAAGKCQSKCIDDTNCTGLGPNGARGKCVGGQCGECSADTDCKVLGDDQTCVNAKCQPPCKTDGDCEGFDRCVAGKCIEGGCQSSRECIASTRNVEATCGTDGKCIVPCQTDLECGNPNGYSFFSCINNQCTYTGCSSDKDCRLYYEGVADGFSSSSSSGGIFGTTRHYTCRDKGLPGNIVRTP
jgi:hypothetical protein